MQSPSGKRKHTLRITSVIPMTQTSEVNRTVCIAHSLVCEMRTNRSAAFFHPSRYGFCSRQPSTLRSITANPCSAACVLSAKHDAVCSLVKPKIITLSVLHFNLCNQRVLFSGILEDFGFSLWVMDYPQCHSNHLIVVQKERRRGDLVFSVQHSLTD